MCGRSVKTGFTLQVTPRKSRVECGWDLASPYVVHPCLHAQWSNLNLWHTCMGHISLKSVCYLKHHQLVTRFDLHGNGELVPYNGYAKGKHHQAPLLLAATNHAKSILKWLYMDLQGLFDTLIQGYQYTFSIIDDYSKKGWKEYLKHKDENPVLLQALIQYLKTSTSQCVKFIQSDCGSEFINFQLQSYL